MCPKISIITPTYNSAQTLEKTILSVISQKLQVNRLEYIIVDGASTDKTRQIINKYSANLDKIISESDRGAYDAMNKGIKVATGDIIGIINSDDWYNEEALVTVEKAFIKNPHIDILYSPIDNYYQQEFVATFVPGKLENLPIRFTLNHPSCFIRKSVYHEVGLYDINYKIVADYDLILRVFNAGKKFHYIKRSLAAYSLNGMSSSTNPIDRVKLIRESWRASTQGDKNKQFSDQRFQAYSAWVFNEIFALPARYFLKPPTARKIKTVINKCIKKPVSESYGKW
ncbi:MAG: glycosyltransferase family 2 protein [Cyanobacteria bacterium P01_A01_bin.45]